MASHRHTAPVRSVVPIRTAAAVGRNHNAGSRNRDAADGRVLVGAMVRGRAVARVAAMTGVAAVARHIGVVRVRRVGVSCA